MNGSLKIVQGVLLLLSFGLVLSSCGGSQTTLGSSDNTTSGTTTVDPTPSTSEPTSAEEEASATIPQGYLASNLFVTVPDTIDYLNLTTLFGDYSNRCTFTSSSVVNDLTCVAEAGELSTYFAGIKMQMNVPANKCNYIRTYPYWYYNYEIGYGPSDISVSISKDASGVIDLNTSMCSVDGSTASCTAVTKPDSWNDIDIDIADEISVKCKYDTSDEDGGQNCCLGKYRLRTQIYTPEGLQDSTDERGKEWGGDVKSCIGGAGKTSWAAYNKAGYPVGLIEKMNPNEARTKIITVKSPIQAISSRSNIPLANYFTSNIHLHTGYGTASGVTSPATADIPARPSPLPYFVDPISDRSGSFIFPGNPYYQFDCLDEAFETNFRIKVLVQEWDTVAALQNYVSTGVSSPVGADESGSAPLKCPGQSGEACNQVQDIDNMLSSVGGSWNNTYPASRTLYFPKHSY